MSERIAGLHSWRDDPGAWRDEPCRVDDGPAVVAARRRGDPFRPTTLPASRGSAGSMISAARDPRPKRSANDAGELLACTEDEFADLFDWAKTGVRGVLDAAAVKKTLAEHGLKGRHLKQIHFKTIDGVRHVVVRTAAGGMEVLMPKGSKLRAWVAKPSKGGGRTAVKGALRKTPMVRRAVLRQIGHYKGAAKGTAVAFLAVMPLTVLQAILSDQKFCARRLGLTLLVDLLKAAAGAVAGAAVATALVASAPAVVVTVVGIAVGAAVGHALDELRPTPDLVAALERELDLMGDAVDEAGRWWRWLNTPAGAFWFVRSFTGARY